MNEKHFGFGETTKKVTIESTKEVENMVKKAETLTSLDELNMPKRTKTYLMSKFNNSLNEILWHGRNMSYIYTYCPEAAKKSKKSTLELIAALDEAGYVRHDINPGRSFCVNRLYRMVFYGIVDAVAAPVDVNELNIRFIEKVDDDEAIPHIDYRLGNERYEALSNPTDGQLETVKKSLETCLLEREYKILTYWLGFEDGELHTLEQAGERFCITRERVHQIEVKALRKLRCGNVLPAIISSDKQRAEMAALIEELKELMEDPAFKKEAEIKQRLSNISKMPFTHAAEAAKYVGGGVLNFSSGIEELELSVRAYHCLKRSGINTIKDVIELPKEDWSRIRSLGSRAMKEVEDRVRAAGYEDFSISA